MAEQIKRAYESEGFSERQQKDINNARARAVRQAWKQEQSHVENGKGTRDWTPEQQQDIRNNGSVQGYEGHHMRSVSNGRTYEEQMKIAGDKNNIQFLEKTEKNNEHLRAHNGNTRNRTNGYYDVNRNRTKDFGDRAPVPPRAEKLSHPIAKEAEKSHVDEYGIDLSKADKAQGQSRELTRTK